MRGRVCALQGAQHVWHRGLHAERYAGEPAFGEPVDICGVHGVWVRFGRDLRARRDAPQRADAPHKEHQVVRREHGRRAATEEHGRGGGFGDAVRALPVMHQFHLAGGHARIVGTRGARTQVGCGVGVEVAIAATPQTERHMHVDFEIVAHRGLSPRFSGRRGSCLSCRGRWWIRRWTGPQRTLPAAPPHGPASSCASCRPSAFQAACACG